MASPRFETPAGAIDGTNVVYTLSRAYSAGSTAVFRNGILQRRDLDDGWTETDPSNGIITMKEAPSATGFPDVLQVFFIDVSPAPPRPPETLIANLRGKLTVVQALSATLRPAMGLRGRLGGTR